jgi:aryl-phospho-beta-D-glucosidase BglC (GH1 family)
MNTSCRSILLLGLSICLVTGSLAQLTPQEAIQQMERGINIGNSLDAYPTETSWGNPLIEEYYFDDIANAGFTSVRIPVTWRFHVSKSSPYTINQNWLNRVDSVVSWGLNRGLYIIINAHHETGLNGTDTMANSIARADTLAKYDSIWSQVARHLKDRSDHLLFEILNEPQIMTQASLDLLNARILSIIRKSNPTRIVIFSGTSYSGAGQLVATQIPDVGDNYLMGYFHSYDPWNFAGLAQGTYGSSSDISSSNSKFVQVNNWSVANNIPVLLDECGAVKQCDYNSRMIYYATLVEQALNHNVGFNVWDDNGNFQVYIRSSRKWNELKDIICYTYKESPTRLQVQVVDSNAVLRWINRTTANDSIIIEKLMGDVFDTFAIAAPDADSIYITDLDLNVYHYFRLQTTMHDTLMYSYPIRFKISTGTGLIGDQTNRVNLFEIYPNPAHDLLILRMDIMIPGARVNIYDISGREMYSVSLNSNELSVDLSGYARGIYFIRLEAGDISYSRKFIKR